MPKRARPIRIDGEFAYVPLTRGCEAIIDATDASKVAGLNWMARPSVYTSYAYRTDYSGPKKRFIHMHRVIMGDQCDAEIDHIDGDGLNNRRDNLRVATGSQNNCNMRTRKDNTSGFKGVSWRKSCMKWRAYISLSGEQMHLGYYETPEDAHAAYTEASLNFHGSFGRVK